MPDRRQEPAETTSPRPGSFYHNVGWNIMGNLGGKLLGPAFQLFIARLLLPRDFGAFAIAVAWLAVFEIVKDCGLTHSTVVGRGGRDETSLQFTVQLGTATVFYVFTLATANLAARRFGLAELSGVLPLVGLVAFVNAFADPILTGLLIEQNYRRLALRQMIAPLASGATGIVLAYRGFGVYSLVFGHLAGQLAGALSLAAGGQIAPRVRFDWSLLKRLMRTGKHIVLQRLFGFLVGQADSFIVGRALGSQSLGLYRMGNLLAFLGPSASVTHAEQVVFTELSANPDRDHFRRRYDLFTYVAGPALLAYSISVYLLAPLVIPAVLGDQWAAAVPVAQVFAAIVMAGFLTPLNIDLSKILGFAGAYSYFAAVRSTVTVVLLLLASRYSTMHVVTTWVVVGFVSSLINDVIFYSSQDLVPLTRGKIAIVTASWAWGAFVIINVMN